MRHLKSPRLHELATEIDLFHHIIQNLQEIAKFISSFKKEFFFVH